MRSPWLQRNRIPKLARMSKEVISVPIGILPEMKHGRAILSEAAGKG